MIQPPRDAQAAGTAILLVEDDPDVAEMFTLGLSISGHEVLIAGDGAVAVELARRRPFDLVLLDMQLPRMDGLTALFLLRTSPSTRALPVVMLTNSTDEAFRHRANSLGITEWLVKSETRPAELDRRVRTWLREQVGSSR
jgi:DNA-binding response OmpR family regulator